jgi:hypothetical protein
MYFVFENERLVNYCSLPLMPGRANRLAAQAYALRRAIRWERECGTFL